MECGWDEEPCIPIESGDNACRQPKVRQKQITTGSRKQKRCSYPKCAGNVINLWRHFKTCHPHLSKPQIQKYIETAKPPKKRSYVNKTSCEPGCRWIDERPTAQLTAKRSRNNMTHTSALKKAKLCEEYKNASQQERSTALADKIQPGDLIKNFSNWLLSFEGGKYIPANLPERMRKQQLDIVSKIVHRVGVILNIVCGSDPFPPSRLRKLRYIGISTDKSSVIDMLSKDLSWRIIKNYLASYSHFLAYLKCLPEWCITWATKMDIQAIDMGYQRSMNTVCKLAKIDELNQKQNEHLKLIPLKVMADYLESDVLKEARKLCYKKLLSHITLSQILHYYSNARNHLILTLTLTNAKMIDVLAGMLVSDVKKSVLQKGVWTFDVNCVKTGANNGVSTVTCDQMDHDFLCDFIYNVRPATSPKCDNVFLNMHGEETKSSEINRYLTTAWLDYEQEVGVSLPQISCLIVRKSWGRTLRDAEVSQTCMASIYTRQIKASLLIKKGKSSSSNEEVIEDVNICPSQKQVKDSGRDCKPSVTISNMKNMKTGVTENSLKGSGSIKIPIGIATGMKTSLTNTSAKNNISIQMPIATSCGTKTDKSVVNSDVSHMLASISGGVKEHLPNDLVSNDGGSSKPIETTFFIHADLTYDGHTMNDVSHMPVGTISAVNVATTRNTVKTNDHDMSPVKNISSNKLTANRKKSPYSNVVVKTLDNIPVTDDTGNVLEIVKIVKSTPTISVSCNNVKHIITGREEQSIGVNDHVCDSDSEVTTMSDNMVEASINDRNGLKKNKATQNKDKHFWLRFITLSDTEEEDVSIDEEEHENTISQDNADSDAHVLQCGRTFMKRPQPQPGTKPDIELNSKEGVMPYQVENGPETSSKLDSGTYIEEGTMPVHRMIELNAGVKSDADKETKGEIMPNEQGKEIMTYQEEEEIMIMPDEEDEEIMPYFEGIWPDEEEEEKMSDDQEDEIKSDKEEEGVTSDEEEGEVMIMPVEEKEEIWYDVEENELRPYADEVEIKPCEEIRLEEGEEICHYEEKDEIMPDEEIRPDLEEDNETIPDEEIRTDIEEDEILPDEEIRPDVEEDKIIPDEEGEDIHSDDKEEELMPDKEIQSDDEEDRIRPDHDKTENEPAINSNSAATDTVEEIQILSLPQKKRQKNTNKRMENLFGGNHFVFSPDDSEALMDCFQDYIDARAMDTRPITLSHAMEHMNAQIDVLTMRLKTYPKIQIMNRVRNEVRKARKRYTKKHHEK